MSGRIHQDRFVDVTKALGQPVRIEGPLPSDRVAVDLVLDEIVVPGLFGAVSEEMVGHIVGIEHFSAPPSHFEALRALLKAGLLRNEFAENRRARISVVIACRRTIGALHDYALVPHPQIRGWWRLNMQLAAVHILSAQALPSDGSWGAFRFATNPPGRSSQNLMAELLSDPRLSTISKQKLIEAVMKQQITNISDSDTRSAYQRAVDFGISQGRRHEQEAILARLSALLNPTAIAVLRKRLGDEEFGQALAETLATK